MEDTEENRAHMKDASNWKLDGKIVQFKLLNGTWVNWLCIAQSGAPNMDVTKPLGDGLFWLGSRALERNQLVGYFDGRQMGPASAYNKHPNWNSDKVILLKNQVYRHEEWDDHTIQQLVKAYAHKHTRGDVYIDGKCGKTGYIHMSNHGNFSKDCESNFANTYVNEQAFLKGFNTVEYGEEILWDYGREYWSETDKDKHSEQTEMSLRSSQSGEKLEQHSEMMKIMLEKVGYVLYHMEDSEYQGQVAKLEKIRQSDFKEVFNTQFYIAQDGSFVPKAEPKNQKRLQAKFTCGPEVVAGISRLVSRACNEDPGVTVFKDCVALETEPDAKSQLTHSDHDPGIANTNKANSVGLMVVGVGENVSLNVLPGSHMKEFEQMDGSTHKLHMNPASLRNVKIRPKHALLAHPTLVHGGAAGFGERKDSQRIHWYRKDPTTAAIEDTHLVMAAFDGKVSEFTIAEEFSTNASSADDTGGTAKRKATDNLTSYKQSKRSKQQQVSNANQVILVTHEWDSRYNFDKANTALHKIDLKPVYFERRQDNCDHCFEWHIIKYHLGLVKSLLSQGHRVQVVCQQTV